MCFCLGKHLTWNISVMQNLVKPFLKDKFNNIKALLSQLYCVSPQLSPPSPELLDVYSGTQGLVPTASATWQLLLFSQNYGDKARQRELVVVSISEVKWDHRKLLENGNRKETKLPSLGLLTWTHLKGLLLGRKDHKLAVNKRKIPWMPSWSYHSIIPIDTNDHDFMTWNQS